MCLCHIIHSRVPYVHADSPVVICIYTFFVWPQMGEKQKMCLVRFLNNTVMVRVGGGWVTLAEFLDNNDPCKGETTSRTHTHAQSVRGFCTSRIAQSCTCLC